MREFFSIDVWVESADQLGVPADGVTVRVDARMPHHRHGMLSPCEVSQVDLAIACSGMRLHMVGYWEFHVDIDDAGLVERAQTSIDGMMSSMVLLLVLAQVTDWTAEERRLASTFTPVPARPARPTALLTTPTRPRLSSTVP